MCLDAPKTPSKITSSIYSRWSPRWSRKSHRKRVRFKVRFGIQEQSSLKWMPRSHTVSVSGDLDIVGKITKPPFQWDRFHVKRPPESTGIVETISRPESVRVLRDSYWAFRICVVLAHVGRVQRGLHVPRCLYSLAAATVRVSVLLRSIYR